MNRSVVMRRYLVLGWVALLAYCWGRITASLFGVRVALVLGLVTLVVVLLVRHLFRQSEAANKRILQAFLDHPEQRLYGLDIARLAKARGGSIYPALARLELTGWVLSDWEEPDGDYPRRRVYWLNPNRPTHEVVP